LHVLEAHEWSPANWIMIDVGTERDQQALELFRRYAGAKYDWVSLLAFIGLNVRDRERFYCFEWCWLAMTGNNPQFRVTPELLILLSKIGACGFSEVTRLSRGLPAVASMAD
jgi:hypothetical protein